MLCYSFLPTIDANTYLDQQLAQLFDEPIEGPSFNDPSFFFIVTLLQSLTGFPPFRRAYQKSEKNADVLVDMLAHSGFFTIDNGPTRLTLKKDWIDESMIKMAGQWSIERHGYHELVVIPPQLNWLRTEALKTFGIQKEQTVNGTLYKIFASDLITALGEEFLNHLKHGENASHFELTPSNPLHCHVAVKAILWLNMVPRIMETHETGK